MIYFVKDQQVEFEENKQHEFKDVQNGKNPVDSIADKTPKYIVAFLNIFNGTGGSIYWGITDNGIVSGAKLTRQQRDEIGKKIDNKFNTINPSITPSMYKIKFHHVYDESHEVISGLYVVEITLLDTENHLYFENGEHCWIKTDSGTKKLSGLELVSELKRRYQIQGSSFTNIDILTFFQFIDDIKPIFYWAHTHVSYKDIYDYIALLYHTITSYEYILFSNVDKNLICGTDYLLRILMEIAGNCHLGYIREKVSYVNTYLLNYIKSIAGDDVQLFYHENNMDEKDVIMFFYNLKETLEECVDRVSPDDKKFIQFIILVIHYLLSNADAFKNRTSKYSDISQSLTDSFLVLIEPYFKNIGVNFIDKTDVYLNDLKDYCSPFNND